MAEAELLIEEGELAFAVRDDSLRDEGEGRVPPFRKSAEVGVYRKCLETTGVELIVLVVAEGMVGGTLVRDLALDRGRFVALSREAGSVESVGRRRDISSAESRHPTDVVASVQISHQLTSHGPWVPDRD